MKKKKIQTFGDRNLNQKILQAQKCEKNKWLVKEATETKTFQESQMPGYLSKKMVKSQRDLASPQLPEITVVQTNEEKVGKVSSERQKQPKIA